MQKDWLVKTLIVGVILLFICMSFNPSLAFDNLVSGGNTLYVGGSGEGNYSKIQDAIDNASDGDTVFVYDDSSPYFEGIRINKSISLIGKDKNTTIIDCNRTGYQAIFIDMGLSDVTVSGFSITGGKQSGVFILGSSFCIIENSNIHSNYYGIEILGDYCSHNIIRNNNVSNNTYGISIAWMSNNNSISYNYISNNIFTGISIALSCFSNKISYNQILNNHYGIRFIPYPLPDYERVKNNEFNILISGRIHYSTIIGNNISFNTVGVYTNTFNTNHILKNNFIFNEINAYFEFRPWNIWSGNYWNGTRLLPYPIYGKFDPILLRFFLDIFGKYIEPLRWVSFDWHPAKEPYNIPTGGVMEK